MPWTPDYIKDLTVFDLLVEFYEDLFENDKNALYDASRGEDGEILFESTGDELIDKWEKELSMGIEPDLTEGLPEKERQRLYKEKEKFKRDRKLAREASDIDEKFEDALRRNPRYAPQPGEVALGNRLPRGLSPLDILGKD